MRSKADIQNAIDRHGPAVWRACVMHFPNSPDAQDAFQETFLKFARHEGRFNDSEHQKAWLLRVAMNTCLDMLKAGHSKDESLDALLADPGRTYAEPSAEDVHECDSEDLSYVVKAMNDLGDPPRTAVYLVLYEGYSSVEAARILDVPVNTVYSWVSRGKALLREALS